MLAYVRAREHEPIFACMRTQKASVKCFSSARCEYGLNECRERQTDREHADFPPYVLLHALKTDRCLLHIFMNYAVMQVYRRFHP